MRDNMETMGGANRGSAETKPMALKFYLKLYKNYKYERTLKSDKLLKTRTKNIAGTKYTQ